MTQNGFTMTALTSVLLFASAVVLAAGDSGNELRERRCLPLQQIDITIGMRLGTCPLGEFEAVQRTWDDELK